MAILDREQFNATRDAYSYPPIPEPRDGLFQANRGFQKPVTIHEWDWSVSFGRWTALVTMPDGWHGWAWPKTY